MKLTINQWNVIIKTLEEKEQALQTGAKLLEYYENGSDWPKVKPEHEEIHHSLEQQARFIRNIISNLTSQEI